VPYRANIYALKSLGVKHIIAVSACGSLREDYAPGNIVIAHQLVDFTKGNRHVSFFGDGVVAHVGVADPFCNELRQILFESVQGVGGDVHPQGKFITVEGPRFSTKAESELFRTWGMDIIGMTTSPEAFLAREAEICYAVMAMVTDYDVWHEHEVSAASVTEIFTQNVHTVQQAIVDALPKVAVLSESTSSHKSLQGALTTSPDSIPNERFETHQLFLDDLLG
jgi:5'-methylthioadenosine phosphorylase